ncbi:NinE family protein [Erwinia sp. Leaf53]|uniref:NinE family protein n=1 Tax=Erwinia sp. Leaf53 TaxID=1736225 RepID=UPI000AC6BE17
MRSGFQQCLDHAMIRSTSRSRRKPKPQPTASQIPTFDYVHGLLQAKWNRMRRTR